MDLRLLRYFVVVYEERNLNRAAARLHMTQPPLTRAIRSLETDLGTRLIERSAKGVSPTAAGRVLYDEAQRLLDQVDRTRAQVTRAAQPAAITVGLLADITDHLNAALLAQFHAAHPTVTIRVREADLTDPSAGLRSGLVDVALTRSPLDEPGIRTRVVGTEHVGVVVRQDDPVAEAGTTTVEALADRDWVRLPGPAGARWNSYWSGATGDTNRTRTVSRTIRECLQSVLWDGAVALAPLRQSLPDGLALVPVEDREPNHLLVAWRLEDDDPVVRSFVRSVATGAR